jgi:hypothetical protein
MPFRSEKQKKYMWANHPEIAERWTKRYGGAVERRLKNQETHSEKSSGKRNVSKRRKRDAE